MINGIHTLGKIHFWKNYNFESEGRPYMIVDHDASVEDIVQIMQRVWGLQSPRIVGLIISNIDSLREWVNPRQIAQFQTGLIKAARSTNMWILTNGANIGTSMMIGDAILQETQERLMFRTVSPYQCPELNFIGVIRDSMIKCRKMLVADEKQPLNSAAFRVNIENRGNNRDEGEFELNPDHTNFLIVRDSTFNKTGINLFILRLMQYLSTFGGSNLGKKNTDKSADVFLEIPVVSILIQGGYDCARLVVECLKKRFPVVILGGSGGLADLLSFAYTELKQKSRYAGPWGAWDAEYIEKLLKPELAEKIVSYFPRISDNALARNLLRDRILEAVRLAKQDDLSFMSVLNVHNYSECQLSNLSVYLLKAIFKSRPTIGGEDIYSSNIQDDTIFKELYLTLDWNCPEVAKNEVLVKNPRHILSLPKDLFQTALLRPNREDFVDLFLTYEFRIHKFITPKRLIQLFQCIYREDFFRSVCWEGILGHSSSSRVSKNFIKYDLNWLIEICTGLVNFVKQDHLYYNVMSMYIRDSESAERQALAILTMWAAFCNRQKLAKVLWKHSDQPIQLGLIISLINKRLSMYAGETNICDGLNKSSKEFVDMAVGVLDECYEISALRAFDLLSEQSADWNYKTAVELSANDATKDFLAHPCCQRWLTDTFLGNIRFRESSCGLFSVPLMFKILSSAFFIFPMFFWVRFNTTEDQKFDLEKSEPEDEDIKLPESQNFFLEAQSRSLSSSQIKISWQRRPFFRFTCLSVFQNTEIFIKPPISIWKMINLMWTAPITKFYIFQLFYIFYLFLISIALLWPSCGNATLDAAFCIWTALNVIEYIQKTKTLYHKYNSIPLFFKCLEIIVVTLFLIIYTFTLLSIGPEFIFLSPYGRKVALSCALLYFFYRFTAMYLPISSTLGPLLYRLRLMVMVDFVNFLKMALVIILSSGVVMQALNFPDLDISWSVLKQAFTRAWLALFITPTDDLVIDEQCNKYYRLSNTSGKCYAGSYNHSLSPYPCPETGLAPYLFTLQYFVLLKLILLTLLYALFASTASRLEEQTDAIWKYQRYLLVIDFANRIPLPSPLSIFYYIFLLFRCLFRILSCELCLKKAKPAEKTPFLDSEGKYNQRLTEADYRFWRHLAREHSNKQEKVDQAKDNITKLLEITQSMNEELEYKKKLLLKVDRKVSDLERIFKVSQIQMENIRLLISMKVGHIGVSSIEPFLQTKSHNILSRQSPYPNTHIQKILVPDKYIPWEVAWLEYDPVTYNKPKSDFSFDLQPHIDEDFMLIQGLDEEEMKAKLPNLQWNCSSINAAGIDIDRSSWILNEDGTNLIYRLENGFPINPFGRTGLKGRGALPRWGPNHYLMLIVTRLRSGKYAGGKVCEFLAQKIHPNRTFQITLPTVFISGSDMCSGLQGFFRLPNKTVWKSDQSVIEFFADCVQDSNYTESSSENSQGLSFEIHKPAYLDDPYNTDQAWKEVKLFQFHFIANDNLETKLRKENMLGWRVVTEDILIKIPPGESNILQTMTNKLKPMII